MIDPACGGARTSVLALNGGSSSIRFAVFETGETPRRVLHGKLDRIGDPKCTLTVCEPGLVARIEHPASCGALSAASVLVDWLECEGVLASVAAVGHRIVHGLEHAESSLVTDALVAELRATIPLDQEHLPLEIAMIDELRHGHPDLPQVACFDTAFHRTMPRVAQLLPIPRRFDRLGIKRYGFHGISFNFLLEELGRVGGERTRQGRVVLAHLGSGSSLAAVSRGRCVDTTMGCTPTGGLVMGTRSGDLDPGVLFAMASAADLSLNGLKEILNRESGLLGMSETSGDVRDLLARIPDDARAAEAIDVFCYRVRKEIGSMSAALGGVDTMVFAGGIGENAPEIRERVCRPLGFLGIVLDAEANGANREVISAATSHVVVRVIPTDEERMLATEAFRLVGV